jgi:hypothetical protein
LELICEKFDKSDSLNPTLNIIKILKDNFPSQSSALPTEKCSDFFQLMGNLLSLYFSNQQEDKTDGKEVVPEIDIKTILIESLIRLKDLESTEQYGETVSDSKLAGLMDLILQLLKSYPIEQDYEGFMQFVQEQEIEHEIFYELLFYVPGKTKNPNLNKCKST